MLAERDVLGVPAGGRLRLYPDVLEAAERAYEAELRGLRHLPAPPPLGTLALPPLDVSPASPLPVGVPASAARSVAGAAPPPQGVVPPTLPPPGGRGGGGGGGAPAPLPAAAPTAAARAGGGTVRRRSRMDSMDLQDDDDESGGAGGGSDSEGMFGGHMDDDEFTVAALAAASRVAGGGGGSGLSDLDSFLGLESDFQTLAGDVSWFAHQAAAPPPSDTSGASGDDSGTR